MADNPNGRKIVLPSFHPGQKAVQKKAKRANILAAGRRWRKTTLLASLAVTAGLKGHKLIWGAPFNSQTLIGWNEVKKSVGGLVDYSVQRREIYFPTGGVIYFRSLDNPDSARGLTADGVLIDEAPFCRPEAWYEVILPTMLDNPSSYYVLAGTPNRRNWFFDEYSSHLKRADAAVFQIPSLGVKIRRGKLVRSVHPFENPTLQFEEIKRLWENMPEETFRQEILAEFLANSGSVFRNLDPVLILEPTTPKKVQELHRGHSIVAGVDWGKTNDFTAISIGCASCKEELAVERFNQISYSVQTARLIKFVTDYSVASILAESNAMGTALIERLWEFGLPVEAFATTGQSKPPLVENLQLSIEREEWKFLNDPIWRNELEVYEIGQTSAGRITYSAPSGKHDDTVIARGLMVRAGENSQLILFGA